VLNKGLAQSSAGIQKNKRERDGERERYVGCVCQCAGLCHNMPLKRLRDSLTASISDYKV